jgi:hypothetical protein
MTTNATTNIAIVNEFWVDADDYHEFEEIKSSLSKTIGLIYRYKEVDPVTSGKPYRAHFTLQGIRNPAQYSKDIE